MLRKYKYTQIKRLAICIAKKAQMTICKNIPGTKGWLYYISNKEMNLGVKSMSKRVFRFVVIIFLEMNNESFIKVF